MALVSYYIGDCPGCKSQMSYGNVDVYGSYLLRGCGNCQHKDKIYLPPVRKKLLYLDQSYFSLVFRGKDERFIRSANAIRDLCEKQALIVPYSNVHEDETHQWKEYAALLDFIKETSRGHEFAANYRIFEAQFNHAVRSWTDKAPVDHLCDRQTAFEGEIDRWESYFRIDVGGYHGDVDLIRKLKRESIIGLVDTFDRWRESNESPEDHFKRELRSAADGYINAYVMFVQRLSSGDFDALLDAPIISRYVERMMRSKSMGPDQASRWASVLAFFSSDHFGAMPTQQISASIYTALREQVRLGAYRNKAGAIQRLSGFFYDVEHIATYAPYCDAVFVDKAMHELLKSPIVALTRNWGTKIFSATNHHEFEEWLADEESRIPDDHRRALSVAYPGKR